MKKPEKPKAEFKRGRDIWTSIKVAAQATSAAVLSAVESVVRIPAMNRVTATTFEYSWENCKILKNSAEQRRKFIEDIADYKAEKITWKAAKKAEKVAEKQAKKKPVAEAA